MSYGNVNVSLGLNTEMRKVGMRCRGSKLHMISIGLVEVEGSSYMLSKGI